MKKVQPWVHHPSTLVHWWVLLVHSAHQMWLFFDDEDLEFAGGIGSMTSTTMNLKK
jgi:hypothetical protein